MLGLLKAVDELLRHLRSDLGVPLLGLRDELFQPDMVIVGGKLEVELAALHVPVVRIEQTPRLLRISIGVYQSGDLARSLLERLAHPVGSGDNISGGEA